MIPLKQNSGDNNCLAVVSAMAFDCRISEFKEIIKDNPPYCEMDFVKFAALKEAVTFPIPKEIIPNILTKASVISIPIQILKHPAMIVVEGESGLLHSIYYDGEKIHDPNPMAANNKPLSNYKIIKWYPIIK